MKTPLKKELGPTTASFVIQEINDPYFDPNWHFHPHYQLFLVVSGTGTRFIGDSIKPFGPGDFVFLGPNMPHLWRSDQAYFEAGSTLAVTGIVVYFPEDFLGETFFDHQEMGELRRLLKLSRQGITWDKATTQKAANAMHALAETPIGFDRLLQLLTLLNELAKAPDYQTITSLPYVDNLKTTEADRSVHRRMQVVHNYVLNHFQEEMSLTAVADLAGMTPPAFCRYFKARANKTFSDFVSEVRIGHACKLLLNEQMSVLQVSLDSGFRTLSNFNRQFRNITGHTPTRYLQLYRKM